MTGKGTSPLKLHILCKWSGGWSHCLSRLDKSLQGVPAASDCNQHELQPATPSAAQLCDGGTAGQVVPAVSLGLCHRKGATDQVTVFSSAVFFYSIHGFLSSIYCTGLLKH